MFSIRISSKNLELFSLKAGSKEISGAAGLMLRVQERGRVSHQVASCLSTKLLTTLDLLVPLGGDATAMCAVLGVVRLGLRAEENFKLATVLPPLGLQLSPSSHPPVMPAHAETTSSVGLAVEASTSTLNPPTTIGLNQSAGGRVSGKFWKATKTPTVSVPPQLSRELDGCLHSHTC